MQTKAGAFAAKDTNLSLALSDLIVNHAESRSFTRPPYPTVSQSVAWVTNLPYVIGGGPEQQIDLYIPTNRPDCTGQQLRSLDRKPLAILISSVARVRFSMSIRTNRRCSLFIGPTINWSPTNKPRRWLMRWIEPTLDTISIP